MPITSFFLPAATTCQKSSTAAGIVGLVLLLGLVAGVITLAVLNSEARGRLAAANSELQYLRPENERLRDWIAGRGGAAAPVAARPAPEHAAPAAEPTAPPQWWRDPSGRHQLRYWDGTSWSHHVADGGLTGTDPAE